MRLKFVSLSLSLSLLEFGALMCGLAYTARESAGQTMLPQFQIDQNFVSPSNQTTGDPPGWTHDPRYIGMVKINVAASDVDADPVIAANKVMNQIRDRIGISLHQGNIPVVVAGFAHCTQPDGSITPARQTCMHHPSDGIVAMPGQTLLWPFNPNLPENQHLVYKYAHIHPWMTQSRLRLKTWMDVFLTQIFARHYNPNEPIPLPTRYAFDSEDQLTGCCDVAWSYQMDNFLKDARWTTDAVLGYNQTMAQLYQAAVVEYGWDLHAGGGTTCRPPFDESMPPNDRFNRPFARWMYEVLRQVKAAIMEETAYKLIRTKYTLAGVPVPHTSNYAEFVADGQPDTFGWFQDKNVRFAGACQTVELPTFDFATRSWGRYYVDPYGEGARYGHTLLDTNNVPQERWAAHGTVTWASKDAPQLYDWTFTPNTYYSHRQANLYLPGQPQETREQMVLRLNRHRIESTQYSEGWERAPDPAPYILFPFQCGTFGLYPTERYTTLTLAMLRGQAVPEIAPFTAAGPTLSLWEALRRCDRRAHAFQVLTHLAAHASADGVTLPNSEDLFYSARTAGAPAETWLRTVASGSNSTGSMIIKYNPLLSSPAEPLRLQVECRLTDVNGQTPASLLSVRGDIMFWDWTASGGGAWSVIHINDDGNGTTHYRFRTADISMRRGFDLSLADAARFVNAAGQAKVLLRWEAALADIPTLPDGQFVAWVDLAQLMRIPGVEPEIGCASGAPPAEPLGDECGECFAASGQTSGPDVNFDGVVNGADVELMIDAFAVEGAAADYDGNDAVEIEDLAIFADDFVSAN